MLWLQTYNPMVFRVLSKPSGRLIRLVRLTSDEALAGWGKRTEGLGTDWVMRLTEVNYVTGSIFEYLRITRWSVITSCLSRLQHG